MKTFAILSALIGAAFAQPSLTNSDFTTVAVGKPFTITWSGAQGAVTLLLKDGPKGNLNTVSTIGSGLSGGSFTWTPSQLPAGQYAIEIQDSSNVPNYSQQFPIAGASGSASASASASVTASASASGSSSASASASTSGSMTSSASASVTSSASQSSSSTTKKASTSSTAAPTTASVPGVNAAPTMAAGLVVPAIMAVGAALL